MNKKILGVFTTAALLVSAAAPVFAGDGFFPFGFFGHDIIVVNKKDAVVKNRVEVSASTGYNEANGDDGGNGGNAGSASYNRNWRGDQRNNGGNGGNGGAGGNGGFVDTGNALARANVNNLVNTNDTKINACACPPENEPCNDSCIERNGCGPSYPPCGCIDDIIVVNKDWADVYNTVSVDAESGQNGANGEDGGNGGNAGDANHNGNSGGCGHCAWGEQRNNGGDGGNGGRGGNGGVIFTGNAWAQANVMNVINSVINRILR